MKTKSKNEKSEAGLNPFEFRASVELAIATQAVQQACLNTFEFRASVESDFGLRLEWLERS